MSAEADGLCGAGYGERSSERVTQRNGYRRRRWDTRVGSIDLAIPKLRSGSYFPEWLLEPRRRSERALINVVAECYVKGVSTRKVDKVVQQLGIEGMSKSQVSELAKSLDEQVEAFRTRPLEAAAYPYIWLDATYVKSREKAGGSRTWLSWSRPAFATMVIGRFWASTRSAPRTRPRGRRSCEGSSPVT